MLGPLANSTMGRIVKPVTATTDDIGAQLRTARERVGLSLYEVGYRLRQALPASYHITQSTLARLETGGSARQDPVLLAALADVYGVSLAELAPGLFDELVMVGELVGRVVAHPRSRPAEGVSTLSDLGKVPTVGYSGVHLEAA